MTNLLFTKCSLVYNIESDSTKICPRLMLTIYKLMLTFIVFALFFIVHSIWDFNCCCHILSCCDACSCWFARIHDVAVIMFLWTNLKWHFDGVFMLNVAEFVIQKPINL